MRVIPVIDLLGGVVVHAVRGKRSSYLPLESKFCCSAEPIAVAEAFKAAGFHDLYIADLDAILCKGNNLKDIKGIAQQTNMRLMVDAGVADIEQAQTLLQHKTSKIIIGTETLSSLTFIQEAICSIGTKRVVVSLDLMNGKVLSKSATIRQMTPLEVAVELEQMGVDELIVLDLARVGSGEGIDLSLLKALTAQLCMKVLVGGGIRGCEDLKAADALGVYGVLLATVLHTGKLSSVELKPYC